MPDNSERRQEGTDDHAGDPGDLQLGHALYARHAHFPGTSSVGSHIVRRIARFNAGSSSLGQRLYRRWAGESGSGFSWPDLEWLHAYRGGRATSTSSSPQRTTFSGSPKSYQSLETATAPILRAIADSPAPIEPETFSSAPLLHDVPSNVRTVPLATTLDGDRTPQAQHLIASAHVDQQNPPLAHKAESTSVVLGSQKIEARSSIERPQGGQPLIQDANLSSSRSHSKGPVYLGRAILQRSTNRARFDAKAMASGPASAADALPTAEPTKVVHAGQMIEKGISVENPRGELPLQAHADQSAIVASKQPIHLARVIPQHSNDTKPNVGAAPVAADPPDSARTLVGVINHRSPNPAPVLRSAARGSAVQGETAVHRRATDGPHSAKSVTVHAVHPESAKSSQEPSLDAPRGDGNTKAIKAAARSMIGEPQGPETQPSQLPLSAQSANDVSPAAELPRKQGIMRAIVQGPAPRVEAVHVAQSKVVSRSEEGPDAGNISTGPASAAIGPIGSSTTHSSDVTNASDARRRDAFLPATSAGAHTAPKGLPAVPSLNGASNRPAPVFRSWALPGSGTPFTPAAQTFGANLVQRHRESLITRPGDVGVGHSPSATVVQPASALTSPGNRVDLAPAHSRQNGGERASSAPDKSQPLTGADAAGDISVHSGLESVGTAPGNAAEPVIQRDSDSALPNIGASVPVVQAETEGGAGDGVPSRTHRILEGSAYYSSAPSTLATSPMNFETAGGAPVVASDLSAASAVTPAQLARPTHDGDGQAPVAPHGQGTTHAARQHLDRFAAHGPNALEQTPRVQKVNDGGMKEQSVMLSRFQGEAKLVRPSLAVPLAASAILHAAGSAASQKHDSVSGGAHAESGFLASAQGDSVLPDLVHRSPVDPVQDRAIHLRPLALGPYRSVSLTHRTAQVAERLQQSSWSAASGSHFLARQSDPSPAPSAVPAAVPMPTASSSTYQGGKASQNLKNVDVGQLANRVYDLLVRRLASERQRRGL